MADRPEEKRIGVIGLGPAGAMAAISAASLGAPVVAYEGNEKVGKKLFLTGKGRCNLTNAAPMEDFMKKIPSHPKFLYSTFSQFSNQDLMAFIEGEGCPLKVERGQRVFPQSDHSSDIIRILENKMGELGVQVNKYCRVRAVKEEGTGFTLETEGGNSPFFSQLVIACGGLSYPSTGSRGDGYRFAQALGHTIQPTSPSLTSLQLSDPWIGEWEGISLRNISLHAREGRKEWEVFGDLEVSRQGLSGPAALTLSSCLSGRKGPFSLCLDLKPALTGDDLRRRLQRERGEMGKKKMKNVIPAYLPRRMGDRFLLTAHIPPDLPLNQLSREEEDRLVQALKAFPLHFQQLGGYDRAVITRGGVSTREINPSTMESRLKKGLYFAGEVIDLDAMTGGYNLQIAFSTGYVAGRAAAQA